MRFNKIFTTILGSALLFGAWSCTEEPEYNPAPEYNGDDVYFSSEQSAVVDIPTGAQSVSVEINRVKAGEELVVGLVGTVTNPDGEDVSSIFNVPTQVTFAKGETKVEIPIGVDFANVEAEVGYQLNIAINGELTSPYGASQAQFTLTYAPWGPFKRIGGTEMAHVTLSGFGMTDEECAVYESRSTVEGDNRIKYQFGDYGCSDLNPDQSTWTSYINGYNATIIVDVDRKRAIWEPMNTGDTQSFGSMVKVTDVYTYKKDINPNIFSAQTPEEIYELGSNYSAETGRIAILTMYYTDAQPIDYMAEYMQLPGYASYDVDFTYLGHFVSEPEKQESVQIEVYKSDDLASYQLRFFEGELSEDDVTKALEEMRKDDSAVLHTDAVEVYEYYLRKEGKYTFVVLGYDSKNNEVYNTTWSFDFTPVQPYNWKSLGYAEYTDGFFYSLYKSIDPVSWDVEVEQSTENPGIIRLVNPYRSGNGWAYADEKFDLKGNYYLTLNIEDPEMVYVLEGKLGVMLSSEDGEVSAFSRAGELVAIGRKPNIIKRLGYAGKLADDAITFPGSTLYLGFSNVTNSEGALEWMDTNLALDVESDDLTEQIKSEGEFYLDLSTVDLNGTAAAKAAPKAINGVKLNKKSLLRNGKAKNVVSLR